MSWKACFPISASGGRFELPLPKSIQPAVEMGARGRPSGRLLAHPYAALFMLSSVTNSPFSLMFSKRTVIRFDTPDCSMVTP